MSFRAQMLTKLPCQQRFIDTLERLNNDLYYAEQSYYLTAKRCALLKLIYPLLFVSILANSQWVALICLLAIYPSYLIIGRVPLRKLKFAVFHPKLGKSHQANINQVRSQIESSKIDLTDLKNTLEPQHRPGFLCIFSDLLEHLVQAGKLDNHLVNDALRLSSSGEGSTIDCVEYSKIIAALQNSLSGEGQYLHYNFKPVDKLCGKTPKDILFKSAFLLAESLTNSESNRYETAKQLGLIGYISSELILDNKSVKLSNSESMLMSECLTIFTSIVLERDWDKATEYCESLIKKHVKRFSSAKCYSTQGVINA